MTGPSRVAPLARARVLPLRKRDVHFTAPGLKARAQIASAGHEHRSVGEPYDWVGLRRGTARFVVLQYTLAGGGRLRWGGRDHDLEPGSLMVVSVPHDHRYWLPAGRSWDFLWLCLFGNEPLDACRTLQDARGPVVQPDPDAQVLRTLVAAVEAVLEDDALGPYASSAHAYSVSMGLFAEAAVSDLSDPHQAGLRRSAAACEQRYGESLSIAELARIAGLSRHHFTRRFQALYGEAPSEYLTRIRLRVAMDRLRAGEAVKDVALACGFYDATYFCKVFRRLIGMTPGAFRETGMFCGEGPNRLGRLERS